MNNVTLPMIAAQLKTQRYNTEGTAFDFYNIIAMIETAYLLGARQGYANCEVDNELSDADELSDAKGAKLASLAISNVAHSIQIY
tara:strand:+ start:1912 stop:2166 length:255 start_codon:yes stop_codon:yes gene_type:complete